LVQRGKRWRRYSWLIVRDGSLFLMSIVLAMTVIFFLVHVVPGDPARLILGPEATQEMVDKLRHEMGFDLPVYVQFFNFVRGIVFEGKFGLSFMTGNQVSSDIIRYFPATFELVTITMIFAFVVGILFGVASGMNQNKMIDKVVQTFIAGGVALPSWFLGLLSQLVLAYWLRILPVAGRLDLNITLSRITGLDLIDSILTFNFSALISCVRHLILPVLTLSASPIAQFSRVLRASVIEENAKDYVMVAEANGLPSVLIRYKYMLKNAISAPLTLGALQYAWLLGNAFVVEAVFSWDGLAIYGRDAAMSRDVNAMVGVTVLMVVVFLITNAILDFLHATLDPRIGGVTRS